MLGRVASEIWDLYVALIIRCSGTPSILPRVLRAFPKTIVWTLLPAKASCGRRRRDHGRRRGELHVLAQRRRHTRLSIHKNNQQWLNTSERLLRDTGICRLYANRARKAREVHSSSDPVRPLEVPRDRTLRK